MAFKMNWTHLLNENRFRPHSQPRSNVDGRNEFEDDYTRLVFSSAVRRLQDKAQVFPLENSDFVRTRLTHSMEVSAIGRSVGASLERELINRGIISKEHKGKIPSLLASAGLAHDLGNPPFGHFGEQVIQEYFKDNLNESLCRELTEEEKQDFFSFEGNAQTFRLLHKLQYLIDKNGLNLTFATLAALLKYPRSSVEGNKETPASYKKFGYFQAEKLAYETVRDATGIGRYRHPLAFIVEAIDDIAYSAADIEDGLKKGVLSFDKIKVVLDEYLDPKIEKEKELLESLDLYYKTIHDQYPEKESLAIQRFRIKAQGFMIESLVEVFMDKHDLILAGHFDDELLLVSAAKNARKAFKQLAYKYIFPDYSIKMKELVGEKVISGLLDIFFSVVTSPERLKSNTKEGKLYSIISPNYRFIAEQYPRRRDSDGQPSLYDRLLLVTDFICGMTDSYALNLYQRLVGVKL